MSTYTSSYFGHLIFFKVGEDNKVLRGQKYELVSHDNTSSSGKFLQEGEYGQYYMKESNYDQTTTFAIDILPEYFKDFMDSINTIEDYREAANNLGIQLEEKNEAYYEYPSATYIFKIPVRLKETKGTPGYQKQDIGIIFNVSFELNYDRNTHEATYKRVHSEAWESWYVDLEPYESINTVEELVNYSYSYDIEGETCINTSNNHIIMEADACEVTDALSSHQYELVPYFTEEKGTVEFEISNTVNNLINYNATNNKNLEYRIVVKNIGDATSDRNVIVTNVPKKITVDENSISDSGRYNKTENTITWNVSLIDPSEELSFTYRATAPNETTGEELIGNSTVKSNQVTTAVISNNTVVTLGKAIVNPYTGYGIHIPNTNIGIPFTSVLGIIVVIAIIGAMLIKKKKNNEE